MKKTILLALLLALLFPAIASAINVQTLPVPAGNTRNPGSRRMVVSSDGQIVSFYTTNAVLYYITSSDGGATWSSQVSIMSSNYGPITTVWKDDLNPDISRRNDIYVTCYYGTGAGGNPGSGTNPNLLLRKMIYNGTTWSLASSLITVIPDASCVGAPNLYGNGLTKEASGRIWVAYPKQSPVASVHATYSDDEGATWNGPDLSNAGREPPHYVTNTMNGSTNTSAAMVIWNNMPTVICGNTPGTLAVYPFNGNDWTTLASPTTPGSWDFSACVTSDNKLHVATTNNWAILHAYYNGSTWSSISTLQAVTSVSPSLTTDGTNVWCFWNDRTQAANRRVVYRKYNGTTWDASSTQIALVTADMGYTTVGNNNGGSSLPLFIGGDNAALPFMWFDSSTGLTPFTMYFSKFAFGPKVTGVSPAVGDNSKAATVNIIGQGFYGEGYTNNVLGITLDDGANTVINIGSASVTDLAVTSAVIPAGVAPGTYNIKVTTAKGTNLTSSVKYVVNPPVVVSNVTPNTGSYAVPTIVTIYGSGFFGGSGASTVTAAALDDVFNTAITLPSAGNITDTSISGATVPAGVASGTYNVKVTSAGLTNLTSAVKFILSGITAPSVTAVNVSTGVNSTPTTVTISGSGFCRGMGSSTVSAIKLDDTLTTSLVIPLASSITDTEIQGAVVPAGIAGGIYNVKVTTAGGTSTDLTKFTVTAPSAPTVTALRPAGSSGTYRSGGGSAISTTITIIGSGFFGGLTYPNVTAINLDNGANTAITIPSATNITNTTIMGAVVPPGVAVGTYNVNVTTGGGISATSSGTPFVIATAPTVISLSTTSGGNTTATASVTAYGSGFKGGLDITNPSADGLLSFRLDDPQNTVLGIGGTTADTSLALTVPAGVVAGVYNVIATMTSGSNLTSGQKFTVTTAAVPNIISVTTNKGSTTQATAVTIVGTNFYGGLASSGTVIKALSLYDSLGTTLVTTISSALTISDTQLNGALVPPVPIGTYYVRVTCAGGTSAVGAGSQFTVTALSPVVTNVNANTGSNLTATTVTITGSGFTGGTLTTIVLDDSKNTGITPPGSGITDTTIPGAIIPAGVAVGAYNIKVGTTIGTNLASSVKFTVTTSAPTVSGIQPSNAIGNAAASTVTIVGSGFFGGAVTSNVTAISLDDPANTSISVPSPTLVTSTTIKTAIIPAGLAIGTYNVEVTTAAGGTNPTSAIKLVVTNPPTVTNVTANTGDNASATTVTITGSGFYAGLTSSKVSAIKLDNPLNTAIDYSIAVIDDSTISGAVIPAGVGAGTYNVKVTTLIGTNATSTQTFAVTTAATSPVINSITPAFGSTTPSMTVTITGSNFYAGLASNPATIKSVSAYNNLSGTVTTIQYSTVSPFSDTLIRAFVTQSGGAATTVPAGIYDLRLTTTGGTSATTGSTKFTVIPVLTSVTPLASNSTSSVTMTLIGRYFESSWVAGNSTPPVTIKLTDPLTVNPDVTVTYITATAVTTIKGLVPSGAATGTYNVKVTVGGATNTSAVNYVVNNNPPTVTTMNPATIGNTGTVSITINGSGFFAGTVTSAVTAIKLDDVNSTVITIPGAVNITDSQIRLASVPSGVAAGTYNVRVTTLSGTNTTSSGTLAITAAGAAPTVTSLVQNTGVNSGATTITINGTGFFAGGITGAVVSIRMDDPANTVVPVPSKTLIADTYIRTAIIPAGILPGTYNIKVATTGGTSTTNPPGTSFIVTAPAITVNYTNPWDKGSGNNTPATVTIIGSGFFAGMTSSAVTGIRLDDAGTTAITVPSAVNISDTVISGAIVPAGIAPGSYNMIVSTPYGSNVTSNRKFVVTIAPTVTGLTPSTGNNSTYTTVNITGTGFFGGAASSTVSSIKLDDGLNTAISIPPSGAITDSTITGAVIPSGVVVGTYNVKVTSNTGTNLTSDVKFVVTAGAVETLSVSVRDRTDSTTYGNWALGSKTEKTESIMDGTNYVLVKNSGNVAEDFSISAAGTHWSFGSAVGINICTVMALFNADTAPTAGNYNTTNHLVNGTIVWADAVKFAGLDSGYNVAASTGKKLYMYLKTPSFATSSAQETITVTIGCRKH